MTIGEWIVLGDRFGNAIGEGHSGTVYRVRHAETGRLAALKLHRGPCVETTDEDFRRETEIVRRQPAPGRMPLFYGSGRWDGADYYAMEYVDTKLPRLSGAALVAFARDLVSALRQLNKTHLHLDVKPENLGIRDGRPCLLDFSCAVALDEARDLRLCVGTYRYRAPEAREGGRLSPKTDLYSLAETLKALCRTECDRDILIPLLDRATSNDAADRPDGWDAFDALLAQAPETYRRKISAASRLAKFKITATTASAALFLAAATAGALYAIFPFSSFVEDRKRTSVSADSRYAQNDAELGNAYLLASNYPMAFYHLNSAVKGGECTNALALYRLADLYARGKGVAQDDALAVKYAQQALALGCTNATLIIRRLGISLKRSLLQP